MNLNRDETISRVEARHDAWDIIVVGGGATGVGVAVDAAARGYDVLLLEQSDFGKATSSRSTKLVHGGVRYLQQGNISLVREALRERGRLCQNAPHLVHPLAFVLPVYRWGAQSYFSLGLKAYDWLAGKQSLGHSGGISRDETIQRLPTVQTQGLRGGVLYYDAQFDDARLLINLVQTAAGRGAATLNYARVQDLIKPAGGKIEGVIAEDLETGQQLEARAKIVVNATGIFADQVRQLDDPQSQRLIAPSQGTHLVFDRSLLPADSALLVPRTRDGRVLFVIPWHDSVLVGTTDTPLHDVSLEPRPLDEEIEFILESAGQYLARQPERKEIRSVFSGIRPLVTAKGGQHTAKISREHAMFESPGGMLTMVGGKWTTYRQMAEDCVDRAIELAGLPHQACVTQQLPIHGHCEHPEQFGELALYGSDGGNIQQRITSNPAAGQRIHADLSLCPAQVEWAVSAEMARTVDDVLARRTRALLLNARATQEAAPAVAELMAGQLGRDQQWQANQVDQFTALADGYRVP